jgi:hypothetical protein
VNRFIWPRPIGSGGAGAAAAAALPPSLSFPSPTTMIPSLDDAALERGRDLLRRKKGIRFTREPLLLLVLLQGFLSSAGGLGGSGQAPPPLPHDGLTFFWRLELLRLIWPMQDTLGDDGSGVTYPGRFLLPPPPRASGGTMETTMGPEKALRWLKEDLLPLGGKAEEKEETVDLRKEASPPPVKLLDLACACFFCFFSMETNFSFPRAVSCMYPARFIIGLGLCRCPLRLDQSLLLRSAGCLLLLVNLERGCIYTTFPEGLVPDGARGAACACLGVITCVAGAWRGQTEKELALDRARADGGGWLIPRRWVGSCDLVAATEIPRAAGRQGQGTSMSTRGWCAAAPTGGFCLTPWPWAPVRAKPPRSQRSGAGSRRLCFALTLASYNQWSWCFKSII